MTLALRTAVPAGHRDALRRCGRIFSRRWAELWRWKRGCNSQTLTPRTGWVIGRHSGCWEERSVAIVPVGPVSVKLTSRKISMGVAQSSRRSIAALIQVDHATNRPDLAAASARAPDAKPAFTFTASSLTRA